MTKWAAVAVAIASLCLLWWISRSGDTAAGNAAAEFADSPDLVIDGATFRDFRESGELLFRLSTEHGRQFTNRGVALISEPQLEYFPVNSPAWKVESQTGLISYGSGTPPQKEQFLKLEGKVRIEIQVAEDESVRIGTESLEIFPEPARARSPGPVTIRTPRIRARAAAMEVNLLERTMHLQGDSENQVHVVFDTHSPP